MAFQSIQNFIEMKKTRFFNRKQIKIIIENSGKLKNDVGNFRKKLECLQKVKSKSFCSMNKIQKGFYYLVENAK